MGSLIIFLTIILPREFLVSTMKQRDVSLSLRLMLEISIFLFVFSLFLRSSPPALVARIIKTLNRRPYLLSLQLSRALIFSTTSAPSPTFSQSLSPRSASLHAINTEDRFIGHGATTVQQVFFRHTAFSSLAYSFLSRRVCQVM